MVRPRPLLVSGCRCRADFFDRRDLRDLVHGIEATIETAIAHHGEVPTNGSPALCHFTLSCRFCAQHLLPDLIVDDFERIEQLGYGYFDHLYTQVT